MLSSYYIHNGLCKIHPYHLTRTVNCKERWFGRLVSDVLVNDFNAKTPEQYDNLVSKGNVTLIRNKGKPSMPILEIKGPAIEKEKIKSSDILLFNSHIHEPPVAAVDWKNWKTNGILVLDKDDLIIINKPAGVPVHPTGRYRKNTIVEFLEHLVGHSVFRKFICYQRVLTSYLTNV